MPKVKTPENRTPQERLIRGAWMKAYEEGELRLSFASKAAMQRTQFLLNADAKAHQDDPSADPEYAMAVKSLAVSGDSRKLELVIGTGHDSAIARSLTEALGESEVERMLGGGGAEGDAQASLQRFLSQHEEELDEEPQGTQPEGGINPYEGD